MKLAAAAHLAPDGELTTHEPDELLRDGQAEARSPVAPRHGHVRLREFVEYGPELLRRDPDAGVAHAEADPGTSPVFRSARNRHHHLARFRELDGVPDEVGEDLAHPSRVAAHDPRCFGGHVGQQLEVLLARPYREEARGRVHELREVKGDGLELKVLGLDLRVVEDVVQDRE